MKFLQLILIIAFLTSACSDKNPSNAIINPNQSSDLALLMRKLADEMTLAKKEINAGKQYRFSDYSDMHTAPATKPEVPQTEFYQLMTKSFLQSISHFNSLQSQTQTDFHDLIQSCIACHQNVCPGPIVRIEKLYFKKNE